MANCGSQTNFVYAKKKWRLFSNVPQISMPLKMEIFSLTLNFWSMETTMRFSSDACSGRTKEKGEETSVANEILFSVKLKTSFP